MFRHSFILLFIALFGNTLLAQKYNGYVLISTSNSTSATLYDTNQIAFKTWTGLSSGTGYSCYLAPGGILVRSAKASGVSFSGGPICGLVQKYDYAGNLIWNYTYSTTSYVSHHDICPMPNGNVLLIAYERRTASEATAMGATNAIEMWPDKIVEIEPTGATTGNVVWEWKSWDHLMQNTDATKPNYVTNLADHPERLNINYKQAKDWQHMNGLDYNPILDQIAWSSHNHNEWYIIDHSTTTAEAAGSTGGNSGKGGDILYRWGNPAAYGISGVSAILNVTHDSHWIPEGSPNAGRLVGFNNKGVSSSQSAVDQVITPVNGYTYTLTPGTSYGPSTYTDRHACNGYTSNMGSSEQLPNGNTLVCIATSGKVYEINPSGTQLWTKTFTGAVPQAHMYSGCYINNTPPAIPTITASGSTLNSSTAATYQWYKNGALITGANNQTLTPTSDGIYVVRITDSNGCVYQYSKGHKFTMSIGMNVDNVGNDSWFSLYPNPGSGIIHIHKEMNAPAVLSIRVYDATGRLVKQQNDDTGINLQQVPDGMYLVHLQTQDGTILKRLQIIR